MSKTNKLPRLLVLMGSGETAPTMNSTHREIFERLEQAKGTSLNAVIIDTPFGFQENHPILASKTAEHFEQALHRSVEVAGLPRVIGAETLELEAAISKIRDADWLFAGPGSPTYCLKQWRDSAIPMAFKALLDNGGALVLSSAAVLTVGRNTIPVYEIYKAGYAPYWEPGLSILDHIGLPVVVIPHYNNNEGGNHDTSKCYLGERRLAAIEGELDDDTFILGIDEHSALVIDLDNETAQVTGKGEVTIRRDGKSVTYPTGAVLSLEELRKGSSSALSSEPSTTETTQAPSDQEAASDIEVDSLKASAERIEAKFAKALEQRDAKTCVAAILELDDQIVEWSRDSLQSSDLAVARQTLRSMVVKLGEVATTGIKDPKEILGPVVEAALSARVFAREDKAYAVADAIRDNLIAVGLEIQDSPTGSTWELTE